MKKALQLGAFAFVASMALLIAACDDSSNDAQTQSAPTAPATAATPQPPVPKPLPTTLVEAIATYAPDMGDSSNALNPGAAELGVWSTKLMTWKDLSALPRTRPLLVLKDSEQERGKLICATGVIIEIAAEDVDTQKAYQGELADQNDGTIYRFVAVRSTGDLVAQSQATFCGVVVGRFDYSNSMGGASHAIQMVGMFKLSENLAP